MSDVRNILGTYFSLEKPSRSGPICQWSPFLSYQDLQGGAKFPIGVSGLQRLHTHSFREDLLKTVQYQNPTLTFQTLQNAESQFLGDLMKIPAVSGEDLVKKVRLLAQLGFYREAIELARSTKTSDPYTRDRFRSLILTYSKILTLGNSGEILEKMIQLFKESAHKKSTNDLIWRFNLGLNIIVTSCQSRMSEQALIYESNVEKAFYALLDQSELPSFSRYILTSRYYRAMSYCPFIRGDRESVHEMALLCEDNARKAHATTQIESIIKAENIFPMLETTARIHEFLGDQKRALSHLQEIVTTVDPMDLKAWMQLGDFYLKMNLPEKALATYLAGEKCQAPHAKILYFKIGAVLEKLNQLAPAIEYYNRSLALEPDGISPKERLTVLMQRKEVAHAI